MPVSYWRRMDFVLLGLTFALTVVGFFVISQAQPNEVRSLVLHQAVAVCLGLVVFVVLLLLSYERLMSVSRWIWAGGVLLLGVVLLFPPINGARGWIPLPFFSIQPIELMKPILAIALGAVFGRLGSEGVTRVGDLWRPVVVYAVPTLLVALQPDMGGVLVLTVEFLAALFVAGMPVRYWMVLLIGGALVLGLFFTVGLQYLPDYQVQRINAFLGGSGADLYQTQRGQAAIEAGGLFGTGISSSHPALYLTIPEVQTDFIFAVVGESFGFIGACLLLLAYLGVLRRISSIGQRSADPAAQVLVSAVFGVFLIHIVENIGMAVGILPVTGIPLPFLSYGGSATLGFLTSLGLVESVAVQKQGLDFLET